MIRWPIRDNDTPSPNSISYIHIYRLAGYTAIKKSRALAYPDFSCFRNYQPDSDRNFSGFLHNTQKVAEPKMGGTIDSNQLVSVYVKFLRKERNFRL